MSFFDGYTPSTVVTSPATSVGQETRTTTSALTSDPLATTSDPTTSMTVAISASSTSINESAHNGTGLSTGAKVGIGIGAGLGGLMALGMIGVTALYVRRFKRGQLNQGDSVTPAMNDDQLGGLVHGIDRGSGTISELAANDSRDFSSVISPVMSQRTWARPMSVEVEGSTPKHRSMGSLPAEEMPIDGHEIPGLRSVSHASYSPGRQVGDTVYEMPGHTPGSDLLEKHST